jgi:hypothetical protein
LDRQWYSPPPINADVMASALRFTADAPPRFGCDAQFEDGSGAEIGAVVRIEDRRPLARHCNSLRGLLRGASSLSSSPSAAAHSPSASSVGVVVRGDTCLVGVNPYVLPAIFSAPTLDVLVSLCAAAAAGGGAEQAAAASVADRGGAASAAGASNLASLTDLTVDTAEQQLAGVNEAMTQLRRKLIELHVVYIGTSSSSSSSSGGESGAVLGLRADIMRQCHGALSRIGLGDIDALRRTDPVVASFDGGKSLEDGVRTLTRFKEYVTHALALAHLRTCARTRARTRAHARVNARARAHTHV